MREQLMIDLYRSETIVARAIPCEDLTRWVITFDNYGIGNGFDRDGFSQDFLREQGISAVHIMGRREDWYQYPDMIDATEAVKAYLSGAKQVVTYGSSMGGYAALRFADLLNANAALALSPQYSINPQKAPFETRWMQDARRIVWLPNQEPPLPKSARSVIVYDPTTIDQMHVDSIALETVLESIPLRYSGHPSGWVIADMHLLAPLLFDVLDGVTDLSRYRKAARAGRGLSSTYLVNLARALPAKRAHVALALAERAVAIKPTHVDALHCLADHLVSAGRYDEAVDFYTRAVTASRNGIAGLVPFATGLLRMGRQQEAMNIVRDVTSRPEAALLAHLHAWHGLIAYQSGLTKEALDAVRRALELHPTEPAYQQLQASYKAELSLNSRWKRWLSRLRTGLTEKHDV